MKQHHEIWIELRFMVWQADLSNIRDVIKSYCPFINDGEVASKITEIALDINERYLNGEAAKILMPELLKLKELATGMPLDDAKEMEIIPDYTETLDSLFSFRNAIGVDPLPLVKGIDYE